MDRSKIYLAQTDTTVGFLSSDDKKLTRTKKRSENQKILQVVDSFDTLKQNTRIPNKFKSFVRRSKRTTFIYPSLYAYRVVDTGSLHHNFIKKVKKMYSTSANITKQSFDAKFAVKNSDIIVYNTPEFDEKASSKIYKLTKKRLKKIR